MENKRKSINCLIPDLPEPSLVLPYLEKIHDNRWYSNFGELSKSFETELTKLLAKTTNDSADELFCCSTSSGTASLEIALAALGLSAGSNVLLPSLTFPATATSILRSNLTPLLSDVCPNSWQLTPKIAFELADHFNISAVLPVATFGLPVDSDGWDNFTKKTNIPVIIDAAGAFPFQKIPKYCTVVFSYHATKPLGIGEGGAIFSRSQTIKRKHKNLSNFGFKNSQIDNIGFNAKLSEYHAAVGLAQIKRWSNILIKRTNVNTIYNRLLKSVGSNISAQTDKAEWVPSLKVIKSSLPSEYLIRHLSNKKIEIRKWYLPALHQQNIFINNGNIASIKHHSKISQMLPITEHLSKHLIGLPFHNFLSKKDIEYIIDSINSVNFSTEIANGQF